MRPRLPASVPRVSRGSWQWAPGLSVASGKSVSRSRVRLALRVAGGCVCVLGEGTASARAGATVVEG